MTLLIRCGVITQLAHKFSDADQALPTKYLILRFDLKLTWNSTYT